MEDKRLENTVYDNQQEMSGEDALLMQIDAFRDKAKQLQSLINGREDRVKELEAMVLEKEARNAELEKELQQRQRQADGLVTDVEEKVDSALQVFTDSASGLEAHLDSSLNDMEQRIGDNVNGIKGSISEKVHSENVMQYRNIQDLLKEYDNSEAQEEIVKTSFLSLKKKITGLTVMAILDFGISIVTLILLVLIFGL